MDEAILIHSKSSVPEGLLSSTIKVSSLTMLAVLGNAGIAIVTSRILGPTGRGQLVLVVTMASFISLGLSLGTNTSARYLLVREAMPISSYLSLGALLAVGAGAVAFALVLVFFYLDGLPEQVEWAIIGALLSTCGLSVYLLTDLLNAFGNTVIATALDAINACMQLIVISVGALFGIRSALVFGIFIAALTLGEAVFVALALSARRLLPRPARSSGDWRRLVRLGLPAIGLNMGQSMTYSLDRLILGSYATAGAVGLYSAGASLSMFFRMVPLAYGQVAFHRAATGPHDVGNLLFHKRKVLAIGVVAIAVSFVFAPQIVTLLLGRAYQGAVLPFRILLAGEVAIMSFHVDSRILAALGDTIGAGLSGIVGVLVTTAADFALVPKYGIPGAAWASVLGYWCMGIVAAAYIRRDMARRKQQGEIRIPPLLL